MYFYYLLTFALTAKHDNKFICMHSIDTVFTYNFIATAHGHSAHQSLHALDCPLTLLTESQIKKKTLLNICFLNAPKTDFLIAAVAKMFRRKYRAVLSVSRRAKRLKRRLRSCLKYARRPVMRKKRGKSRRAYIRISLSMSIMLLVILVEPRLWWSKRFERYLKSKGRCNDPYYRDSIWGPIRPCALTWLLPIWYSRAT